MKAIHFLSYLVIASFGAFPHLPISEGARNAAEWALAGLWAFELLGKTRALFGLRLALALAITVSVLGALRNHDLAQLFVPTPAAVTLRVQKPETVRGPLSD